MSIKAKITSTVAKQVLLVKRESPVILFVAGVACVGTSTVLACRATLKVHNVMMHHDADMSNINDSLENPAMKTYVDRDAERDTQILRIQTGVKLIKLYIPAVAVGLVGIAALGGSHYLLNKRNAALTAAYAGLDQSFREYRKRVAQEVGVDREREIHYEAQNAALHEKNKDGSVSTSRRKAPHDSSIYARFFDQLNPNWEPIAEYNKVFLHANQTWATNRLNARGYLFLNEVYRQLGMEESRAGQCVGWVLSDDGTSDNFCDFGIFDGGSRELRAFVNGEEGSILLDFNVAGNILDRVPFQRK